MISGASGSVWSGRWPLEGWGGGVGLLIGGGRWPV